MPRQETDFDIDNLKRVHSGAVHSVGDDATITIRPVREAYIPQATDRRYFQPDDHVAVYVDEDRGLIAFETVDPLNLGEFDDGEVLSLGREHNSGGSVSLKSAFAALGVGPGELPIDESVRLPIEDEDPFLVVDVSEILPDHATVDTDDATEADTEAPTEDAATDGGTAVSSAVRTDGLPVSAKYADHDLDALAEETGDLREFAEALDETTGRARVVAMDADVYRQLDDNPNAYRGGSA